MQITVLGSGAAPGVPLGFCRCETCRAAREKGGRDLRRRSSLLINDDLLIDMGADAPLAALTFGRDLSAVRYWLQTHAHADHFDPGHLIARTKEYGAADILPLTLYASPRTVSHLSAMLDEEQEGAALTDPATLRALSLSVVHALPGTPATLGAYTVHAIPVCHDDTVGSMIFALTDGTHALLYATDSPLFTGAVWQALAACGLRFDCVFLDHTVGGDAAHCPSHMNAAQVQQVVTELRARCLVTATAQIYATHISHEGNPPHAEFTRLAAAHGYAVAYDGLCLTL